METDDQLHRERDEDPTLTKSGIYQIFRQNAEKNKSHPLIIYHGRHVSYYNILSMVDSMAESLSKRFSIEKGQNIGIALPLSPQFFISFLAAQKIGAVAVPLDHGINSHELEEILSICEIKVLICATTTSLKIGGSAGIRGIILTKLQDFLPFEKAVLTTSRSGFRKSYSFHESIELGDFNDFIYGPKGELSDANAENEAAAAMIFSPSRNGDLSGLIFSSSNIISSARGISRNLLPAKGRFRIASMLPVFTTAGFQFSVTLPIFMGGTVICTFERSNYGRLLRFCSLFDCDYMIASPYDLNQMLENKVANQGIRSLKGVFSNSYLLSREVREAFEKNYGIPVIEYYGIPELLGVSHMQSADRSKRKPGGPGLPLSGVEARIIDESTKDIIQSGSRGTLLVRGPQLMIGYCSGAKDGSEYFIDGFFDSGDLARVDHDGQYFIEDRKREAISSSGILVSPHEIESVIATVEGVKEVAVIGIDNGKGNEEITAIISPGKTKATSESKLKETCSILLSPYKRPKRYDFRDELPKSMAGKILKRQLLEETRSRKS